MSPIAQVYEELKNNNLALEGIRDMLCSAADNPVNPERLFYLLKLITESNDTHLSKLAIY